MIYTALTHKQTNIWISNIKKVIGLGEALSTLMKDRIALMDTQYIDNYRTGFFKFWYDSEYYISASGKAFVFGGFFSLTKVDKLTEEENRLRYFISDYYSFKQSLLDTQERWNKYAKQPFEIHESDVIFYQKMKDFHKKLIKMAKIMEINYEAFHLDEDCQNSGR